MPQKTSAPKPPKPPHLKHIKAAEWKRLHALTLFERAAREKGRKIIAGIDEAGRGPLAGPVVAAACVLPEDRFIVGVDDSKKLTPEQRRRIFEEIKADTAIRYSVGVISSEEIDRINIFQATKAAMFQAIAQLSCIPDYLLVDGMHLEYQNVACEKIVKGDQLSQSIAAASVIAKEMRDKMMVDYHQQWPQYGFDKHKGYGTQAHVKALLKHGPCPIHRTSFKIKNTEEICIE